MADRVSEQIKLETEIFRMASVAELAIGGSTVGLVFGVWTWVRVILFVLGCTATAGGLVLLVRMAKKIHLLIQSIEEPHQWK